MKILRKRVSRIRLAFSNGGRHWNEDGKFFFFFCCIADRRAMDNILPRITYLKDMFKVDTRQGFLKIESLLPVPDKEEIYITAQSFFFSFACRRHWTSSFAVLRRDWEETLVPACRSEHRRERTHEKIATSARIPAVWSALLCVEGLRRLLAYRQGLLGVECRADR